MLNYEKVYFGYREQDKMPSHSGESNFHSKLDEPFETSSSFLVYIGESPKY